MKRSIERFLQRCLAAMLASTAVVAACAHVAAAPADLDLAGEWRFALDRSDAGLEQTWFSRDLPDRIQLPGVLQAQGYGDEISIHTPWVLSLYDRYWYLRADYQAYTNAGNVKVPFLCQPPRHFLGAAWYQRDVQIPTNWMGRRAVLFLERARWETRAWLDDRPLGTNNSLCTPHAFEVGVVGEGIGQTPPGQHRLTVRCDNRMLMRYRPDAHAVSDSLGSTWNGLVGKLELRSTPPVWIEDVQVFPNAETNAALVKVRIGNVTGTSVTNQVSLDFIPRDANGGGQPVMLEVTCTSRWTMVEAEVASASPVTTWDEFHPQLYELTVTNRSLEAGAGHGQQIKRLTFGFRDVGTDGPRLLINGREAHLRGTHTGGDFPATGYPSCDVDYWLKLFRTCREWGLNHVRFHSFCPPEAAFTAADAVGVYLQIEPGMWNEISPGTPMEARLYAETERILKAYGNHPSFVLMSASNEAKGHWKEALPRWAGHFRDQDSRHLYTPDTGWSLIDEPGPVQGADFLAVHRIGRHMMRGEHGWFGRDYGGSTRGVNVPIVTHEVGQWCAYPNYSVINKFTGYMRPGNYEIFRDSLAAYGLGNRDRDFAYASGRFQLACYKEEIEANLRTPGLAGFQLLDLHDYVGQGTALVGVLDPFWEEKGYIQPDEWRQFCSPTVPLARLRQRVFQTTDTLEVPVEVAHFGRAPVEQATASWRVINARGEIAMQGEWPARSIPIGQGTMLGTVSLDLSQLAAPEAYRLVVEIAPASRPVAFQNSWNFWLYPAQVDSTAPEDVLVTRSWEQAEAALSTGGKVLFEPQPVDLDWSSPPLDRVPIFWNRLMNPGWGRMLGLWCDTNHPALAGFPTDTYCDWQWTSIIRGVRAMNLRKLPQPLQPIVQAIDDWNRNWKLGVVYECSVGPGKLMVCTVNLEDDLDQRPVARQLRRSLLDYMAGPGFAPKVRVSASQLRSVLFDSRIMSELGATVEADGADPQALIDGDPNTYWLVGAPARGVRAVPHPHTVTVRFPQPVPMRGLVFMPRQNDRNHQGDIREYRLEISDDGREWREVLSGALVSTFDPQTVTFGETLTARQLRLTALSGFGGDPSTALAELAVLYAGPRLVRTGDGTINYQRVRSTSTDVDEGEN